MLFNVNLSEDSRFSQDVTHKLSLSISANVDCENFMSNIKGIVKKSIILWIDFPQKIVILWDFYFGSIG